MNQSEGDIQDWSYPIIIGAWCLWVFISTSGFALGAGIAAWLIPSNFDFYYRLPKYSADHLVFVVLATTPFAVLQCAVLAKFAKATQRDSKRTIFWIPITVFGFSAMLFLWTAKFSLDGFLVIFGVIFFLLILLPTGYVQWRFVISAYNTGALSKEYNLIVIWMLGYLFSPLVFFFTLLSIADIVPSNRSPSYEAMLFFGIVGFSCAIGQASTLAAVFAKTANE